MTWQPDVFIYHSPCDDGFGAAWAVYQRWGEDVEYVPATYGKPAPDVSGKNVLIGDFSFKRPVLDAMLQNAKSIVIIDHHKTAQEDLTPFAVEMCGTATLCADDTDGLLRDLHELDRPPCVAWFDMEKSGARLVWEFCHPGNRVPWLIKLIEDRDLWRFQYSDTKAFSLFLRSHAYNFQTWSSIADALEDYDGRKHLFAQAQAIQLFYDQKISEIVREARTVQLLGFDVPAANASWAFASDVAHELLTANPDAPFAMTYYDRGDGRRSHSLRSDDDRVDVSAIAKEMGGGGHRNAAGFETPIP